MATADKFKLNPDDVLGFSYQQYVSNVRGLALSQPSAYFELRAQVMEAVKRKAVGALYNTIFEILSSGRLDGKVIGKLGEGKLVPNYPSQKINDFSIECAAMLGEQLNKVVDILVPDDFSKLASSKLAVKGHSASLEI